MKTIWVVEYKRKREKRWRIVPDVFTSGRDATKAANEWKAWGHYDARPVSYTRASVGR